MCVLLGLFFSYAVSTRSLLKLDTQDRLSMAMSYTILLAFFTPFCFERCPCRHTCMLPKGPYCAGTSGIADQVESKKEVFKILCDEVY